MCVANIEMCYVTLRCASILGSNVRVDEDHFEFLGCRHGVFLDLIRTAENTDGRVLTLPFID
jgi:hypothetical protein